jgi:hypothetical protein
MPVISLLGFHMRNRIGHPKEIFYHVLRAAYGSLVFSVHFLPIKGEKRAL